MLQISSSYQTFTEKNAVICKQIRPVIFTGNSNIGDSFEKEDKPKGDLLLGILGHMCNWTERTKKIKDQVVDAVGKAKTELTNLPPVGKKVDVVKMAENLYFTFATLFQKDSFNLFICNDKLRDSSITLLLNTLPTFKILATNLDSNTTQTELIKKLIETGIGSSKVAQMLSEDNQFVSKLPDDVKKAAIEALKSIKSKGTPTRTLKEAQTDFNKIFGKDKFKAVKLIGVGTIAETYLAKVSNDMLEETQNKKEVIIKIRKRNVHLERIEAEQEFLKTFIDEFYPDEKLKDYYKNIINTVYEEWKQELAFTNEASGAINLDNTRRKDRFKIARPIEVKIPAVYKNRVLVLEKAEGMPLDDFKDMLKPIVMEYNKLLEENNGDMHEAKKQLLKNNKELFDEQPWLVQIDKLKDKIGFSYLKAMTYQLLYFPSRWSGYNTKTIHGDPHEGNVFINWNPTDQQFDITFIDTGSHLNFNADEFIDNLVLASCIVSGYSEKLATLLVKDAVFKPEGKTDQELIANFTKDLDKFIFNSGYNLTADPTFFQNQLDQVIERNRILPSPKLLLSIKTFAQTMTVYQSLRQITGEPFDSQYFVREVIIGCLTSLSKSPKQSWEKFSQIVKHIMDNDDPKRVLAQWLLPERRRHNR